MADVSGVVAARVKRVEERLALPVSIAAVASVPAVCLAVWGDGAWAMIGVGVDWCAAAMLWAEWLTLMVVSRRPLTWLREHKWVVFVAVVTVPAVVLMVGPAQVLRLARLVGSLRVWKMRRITNAAKKLRRWFTRRRHRVVVETVALMLACVFLAASWWDVDKVAWQAVAWGGRHAVAVAVVCAGLVVAAAMSLWWWRGRDADRRDVPPGNVSPERPGTQ